MGPRSKADQDETRGGITKAGNRTAPVLLTPVGAALDTSYFLAMTNQTRTEAAVRDLGVQYLQCLSKRFCSRRSGGQRKG